MRKKYNVLSPTDVKTLKINKFNPLIILTFLIIFTAFFFVSSNLVNWNNESKLNNFKEVTENDEFLNFTNFILSKINSPYEEINYVIKNNDTVEKILSKFNVRDKDIKKISIKLKENKHTNIYIGRKLELIIKKLEDGSNTLISFLYPINNTSTIEIRKYKNDFLLKENILQLYKKEVVVKNVIKDNLYSAAIESGVQPNIIIEFARVFGFEVDFQRDIIKGDWF